MNDRLELLWDAACNTGHYPFAYDIDGDGKDELTIGYSLFDHDGKGSGALEDKLQTMPTAWRSSKFKPDAPPRLLLRASDEGIFFTDMKGNVLKHLYLGHVQNPAIANFRDDLPGLEAVSINFWGNQGILHFYDAEGNVYHDFEPAPSRQHVPADQLDGTAAGVLRPVRPTSKKAACSTAGAAASCSSPPTAIRICAMRCWTSRAIAAMRSSSGTPTRSGSTRRATIPSRADLYKPVRNPLYNYSNYQATVSLPGWSE